MHFLEERLGDYWVKSLVQLLKQVDELSCYLGILIIIITITIFDDRV